MDKVYIISVELRRDSMTSPVGTVYAVLEDGAVIHCSSTGVRCQVADWDKDALSVRGSTHWENDKYIKRYADFAFQLIQEHIAVWSTVWTSNDKLWDGLYELCDGRWIIKSLRSKEYKDLLRKREKWLEKEKAKGKDKTKDSAKCKKKKKETKDSGLKKGEEKAEVQKEEVTGEEVCELAASTKVSDDGYLPLCDRFLSLDTIDPDIFKRELAWIKRLSETDFLALEDRYRAKGKETTDTITIRLLKMVKCIDEKSPLSVTVQNRTFKRCFNTRLLFLPSEWDDTNRRPTRMDKAASDELMRYLMALGTTLLLMNKACANEDAMTPDKWIMKVMSEGYSPERLSVASSESSNHRYYRTDRGHGLVSMYLELNHERRAWNGFPLVMVIRREGVEFDRYCTNLYFYTREWDEVAGYPTPKSTYFAYAGALMQKIWEWGEAKLKEKIPAAIRVMELEAILSMSWKASRTCKRLHTPIVEKDPLWKNLDISLVPEWKEALGESTIKIAFREREVFIPTGVCLSRREWHYLRSRPDLIRKDTPEKAFRIGDIYRVIREAFGQTCPEGFVRTLRNAYPVRLQDKEWDRFWNARGEVVLGKAAPFVDDIQKIGVFLITGVDQSKAIKRVMEGVDEWYLTPVRIGFSSRHTGSSDNDELYLTIDNTKESFRQRCGIAVNAETWNRRKQRPNPRSKMCEELVKRMSEEILRMEQRLRTGEGESSLPASFKKGSLPLFDLYAGKEEVDGNVLIEKVQMDLILEKGKANGNGAFPLAVLFKTSKKELTVPTGYFFQEEEWDDVRKQPSPRSVLFPEAKALMRQIWKGAKKELASRYPYVDDLVIPNASLRMIDLDFIGDIDTMMLTEDLSRTEEKGEIQLSERKDQTPYGDIHIDLVLYRTTKDNEGRYPVLIMLSRQGIATYIRTGYSFKEEDWDLDRNIPLGSTERHIEIAIELLAEWVAVALALGHPADKITLPRFRCILQGRVTDSEYVGLRTYIITHAADYLNERKATYVKKADNLLKRITKDDEARDADTILLPNDLKASWHFILDESQSLEDGRCPLLLKVSCEDQVAITPTDLFLLPSEWDPRTELPESGMSQKEEIMLKLTEIRYKLQYALEKGESTSISLPENYVPVSRRGIPRCVGPYIKYLIKEFKQEEKYGNMKVYLTALNRLRKVMPSLDVPFSELNKETLDKLCQYMRNKSLKDTTISVQMRTLRAIWNSAIVDRVAKKEEYPFERRDLEILNRKTRKRCLTKEDILKVIHYEPGENERELRLYRDLFAFSYYCCGIPVYDLCMLRKENLRSGVLRYRRKKTHREVKVTVPPPASDIIKRYELESKGFLFPLMDEDRHKTEIAQRNRVHKVTGTFNRVLKILAGRVGLEQDLSSYVARHTFATVLKREGVPVTQISQALGHQSVLTTQIYLGHMEDEKMHAVAGKLL